MTKVTKRVHPSYIPSTRKGAWLIRLGKELEEAKQQFEMGNPIGVVDALFMLLDTPYEIPDWIRDNFPRCLDQVLRVTVSPGRGQRKAAEQLREDIIHYCRWDAVRVAEKKKLKGTSKFEFAIELLEGTSAGGVGIKSIERSYGIVRSALKSRRGRARFRYPRSAFVMQLVWGWGPGY